MAIPVNLHIKMVNNVDLSEDLYRDGYYDITNCDYSSVVIQKMKEVCIDKVGLKCIMIIDSYVLCHL